MRRRPVVVMVVAGVLATAIGIAIGLSIHWFPSHASKQAGEVNTLYDVLMIASIPMFVIVATVVITAVIRFRMRPGQEDEDGPPIHGSTRLEVLWTALPVALILGLCAYSYVVLVDTEKAPANAAQRELQVDVTAEQFAWSFTYPKDLTGGKQLTTTELWLPEGRSVRFSLRSEDVIHDFWVPNFSTKLDVVPGITGHYRITPDRLGTYPVVCAELCGLGHSVMRSQVHVVTPAQFAAWLKKQQQPAAPKNASPAQLAAAGKQIFTGGAGCGGCHTLADAGTSGQIGPDLDQALKGKDAAFIRQSIEDPNAVIAKGYGANIMPGNFGQTLGPQEIDALVAYLKGATSK
jgi:cytochrome c oxidase subunit 2